MSFEFIEKGLCCEVRKPIFGLQDKGITPGGPMDAFSMQSGNILLNQDKWIPALEFILPPKLFFTEDVYIVLTGANYANIIVENRDEKYQIEHGKPALIKKGSNLLFSNKTCGFRTYLSYRKASEIDAEKVLNQTRGNFSSWYSSDKTIRVIRGPEYNSLENPEMFFDNYWKIGLNTNQMGMRLENSKINLKSNCKNMISAPVANGTVQLTQDGPIILLKHRQTVGGYPRIFNVISADVDLLGQYAPQELIKFSEVSITEARNIMKIKNNALMFF